MATVLEIVPGTYARMGYTQVLKTLDTKIDKLAHVGDPIARLQQGAELLLGVYSFSQELGSRCWAIRGVLELQARVE